jgi:HlyD family secretion protein
MDIPRPNEARKRRRRRIAYSLAGLLVLVLITVGLSRLDPAAPSVEKNSVHFGTVRRGEFLRQVRGPGTLVPEQIQFVQVDTDGRVERILVLPGAEVEPDTILMELSNPELKQAAFDAEWLLEAAKAQMTRLKVQLESDRLSQESAAATLKAEFTLAQLEAEADEALAKDGLVADLAAKRTRSRADELGARYQIEKKRIEIGQQSTEAQLAVQEAEIKKMNALVEMKRRQVEALRVRAGISGVLQQIGDLAPLQIGQRVTPSATLAKIVQPSRLKAEIRIAETSAKDVMIGQTATVDIRTGVIIPGKVIRVHPAPVQGSVTVEVKLEGELPRGARPDLSVDGVVELERLTSVLYVGRPMHGPEHSTVGIFKVIENGRAAERVTVKLGRTSVSFVEVIEGLNDGDQIVLSDMSNWDAHSRLRLN